MRQRFTAHKPNTRAIVPTKTPFWSGCSGQHGSTQPKLSTFQSHIACLARLKTSAPQPRHTRSLSTTNPGGALSREQPTSV
jgi:hypothetical protein